MYLLVWHNVCVCVCRLCLTTRVAWPSVRHLLASTVVLSTLLYGSETWTPIATHIKRLQVYIMRCAWVILGVTEWDEKRNTKLRALAALARVEVKLMRRRQGGQAQVPSYMQAGWRQMLSWWSEEAVEWFSSWWPEEVWAVPEQRWTSARLHASSGVVGSNH